MPETIRNTVYEYLIQHCTQPMRWFSEREVAEALQVKRSAVREVLLYLEGEGAVYRAPQRGYHITDYASIDLRALDMFRFILEHSAIMKGVTNATAEDIAELGDIMVELERAHALGEAPAYMVADMKFHSKLVSCSHDDMFIKLFSVMKIALYGKWDKKCLMEESHQKHRQIYQAFVGRDYVQLEQAVYGHIGKPFIGMMQPLTRLLDNTQETTQKLKTQSEK